MGNHLTPQALRYHAPVLVCLLAILVLIFLPTGFEGALLYQEAERCKAEVLSVDDSAIIDTGLVRSGEQRCQLEILDGAFAGQTVTGINMLNGSLEQDKIFAPGDVAQVVVSHDGDTITTRIHGTDEDIRAYYRVGSVLNMGAEHDRLVAVVAVDIMEPPGNAPHGPVNELQRQEDGAGV